MPNNYDDYDSDSEYLPVRQRERDVVPSQPERNSKIKLGSYVRHANGVEEGMTMEMSIEEFYRMIRQR